MMVYFTEKEFQCGCGCRLDYDNMDEHFCIMLDIARGHAEIPFKITSSIRCADHNSAVKGSKKSSHLQGIAVDIAAKTAFQRYRILWGLHKVGLSRIGIGQDFIHVDDDKDKPKDLLWLYR